jgi:hypothetical protein
VEDRKKDAEEELRREVLEKKNDAAEELRK